MGQDGDLPPNNKAPIVKFEAPTDTSARDKSVSSSMVLVNNNSKSRQQILGQAGANKSLQSDVVHTNDNNETK